MPKSEEMKKCEEDLIDFYSIITKDKNIESQLADFYKIVDIGQENAKT
jgi:hypothetical protein